MTQNVILAELVAEKTSYGTDSIFNIHVNDETRNIEVLSSKDNKKSVKKQLNDEGAIPMYMVGIDYPEIKKSGALMFMVTIDENYQIINERCLNGDIDLATFIAKAQVLPKNNVKKLKR